MSNRTLWLFDTSSNKIIFPLISSLLQNSKLGLLVEEMLHIKNKNL